MIMPNNTLPTDFFLKPYQARQVKWFEGNRTIGEMLDDNSMTLEMLNKGIESSNEKIRAAT